VAIYSGKNENKAKATKASLKHSGFANFFYSHQLAVYFRGSHSPPSKTQPVLLISDSNFLYFFFFSHQWIRDYTERPCPVCKSMISKEKLIPMYGRGKQEKDPRFDKIGFFFFFFFFFLETNASPGKTFQKDQQDSEQNPHISTRDK
jgi:hypothetical protein